MRVLQLFGPLMSMNKSDTLKLCHQSQQNKWEHFELCVLWRVRLCGPHVTPEVAGAETAR